MSTETKIEKIDKKARHRSPAYPAIGLQEAIEKARTLWECEKRNEVAVDVAAKHWDYQPKSSGNLLTVSALKKFGLVTDRGSGDQRYIKLTDLAFEILRADPNSQEWLQLVQRAAQLPKLIAELWKTDKDNPRSSPSLAKYLEFEKDFNPAAIAPFIRAYRNTISYAKLSGGDIVQENDGNETGEPSNQETPKIANLGSVTIASKFSMSANLAALREFTFPLSGGIATLRVPFPMGEDDFDFFIETLKLWKKKLVKADYATCPPLPANAMWKAKDSNRPVKIVALMGEKDGQRYFQTEDGTGIPESELVF